MGIVRRIVYRTDMAEQRTRLEGWIEAFRIHISGVRRFSARTCEIYSDILGRFSDFVGDVGTITSSDIRNYEVHIIDSEKLAPKTANLHMSVLSSFCAWLVRTGELKSNPVRAVRRPKIPKRLPEFYREDAMNRYLAQTDIYASPEFLESFRAAYALSAKGDRDAGAQARELYEKRLERAVISTLLNLGIRRSELVGMNTGDMDMSRRVVTIRGKGDKMREIPVIPSLCEEIMLYLKAVEIMAGGKRTAKDAMFVTWSGGRIYPVLVDRIVKGEFSRISGVTGRRSPHVLRHTLATELLDGGTELNSIKEMLGHASLATTQIYTHNSVAKLKQVYKSAHPRAKKGGNYGD